MEYFPFGTYRETVDYDTNFPDVFYTFTGQEEDDELGLYNFKARLYDPALGRFISPDRLVQAPENPQTLNRYTYCLNNPLIYTDPSGEIAEWVVFAIIAVATGAFVGAAQADVSGGNILKGALIGALIGAVSFGVGYGVGFVVTDFLSTSVFAATTAGKSAANIVGAMAGGFSGGAVSGGLNAAVYGGNVWQSALYGGLAGAAIAGLIQGAIELNNWVNTTKPEGYNLKTSAFNNGENGDLIPADLTLGNHPFLVQTQQVYPGVQPPNAGDFFSGLIDWMQQGNAMNLTGDAMQQIYKIRLTVPCEKPLTVHVSFRPGPPAYDLRVGMGHEVMTSPGIKTAFFEYTGLKGCFRWDPFHYNPNLYWRKM